MTNPISTPRSFNMLSLDDLLEARDHYHDHLLAKQNVIATAIGRYRIRCSDPWPQSLQDEDSDLAGVNPSSGKAPRRLQDSEVRGYSWPSLLVFVRSWVEEASLSPYEMVPKRLHLRGNRAVPVCLIEAPPIAPMAVRPQRVERDLIGGGCPLMVRVQGRERFGALGALVSDGNRVYALTNHHVAAVPGTTVYALLSGDVVPIGRVSEKHLRHLPFDQVYRQWKADDVRLHVDVGLVEIDDLHRFTSSIVSVGRLGPVANVGPRNLDLSILGSKVRAFGAASGEMRGEIQALFYRYKSIGGTEYTTDFLIGPRRDDATFQTHPGDSGTLWLFEDPEGPQQPLAVQWGGHVFADADNAAARSAYALASNLSTALNALGVDLVNSWAPEPEFWGAMGHYSLALHAIDAIKNPALKALMTANTSRISYPESEFTKDVGKGLSKADFVPLADVPDYVWKSGADENFAGRRVKRIEGPTHFADVDHALDDGTTLLEQCLADPAKIDPQVWLAYYRAVGATDYGSLPFRVGQIFAAMVDALENNKKARFVAAAGILSHYVGDACQPLHCSHMHDGDPNGALTVVIEGGEEKEVPVTKGVHSAFESDMLNRHFGTVLTKVRERVAQPAAFGSVTDEAAARRAAVALMGRCFNKLSPREIVDSYESVLDLGPAGRADALWESLGDRALDLLADGAGTLAMLWDAAWEAGRGDQTSFQRTAVPEGDLRALYFDKDFLPSRRLKDY